MTGPIDPALEVEPPPPWLAVAWSRLRDLPPRVDPAAIEWAGDLLAALELDGLAAPRVVATPDGAAVILTWGGRSDGLAVYARSPAAVSWTLFRRSDALPGSARGAACRDAVRRQLARFYCDRDLYPRRSILDE